MSGGQYWKVIFWQLAAALAVLAWATSDEYGGWTAAFVALVRSAPSVFAALVRSTPGEVLLWFLGNFFFFPYVWHYMASDFWGWAGDVNDDDQRYVTYYASGRVERGTGAGCLALAMAGGITVALWFAAFILGPIIARIYTWRKRQALYYDSDRARYNQAVRAEKRLKFLLGCIVIAGVAALVLVFKKN